MANDKESIASLLLLGLGAIVALDILTAEEPMTREFQDNNPFGVTGTGWDGQIGSDGPLAIFSNKFWGIRAGFKNLNSYFEQGINTVDGIGNTWPGQAAAYGPQLAQLTGLTPGVPLNYWTDGINLMSKITILENTPDTVLPYTYLVAGLLAGKLS